MGSLRRLRHASAFLLLCLVLASGSLRAQTSGIMPWIDPQFFDSNGDPLAGGSLTFYAAGTNTLIDVFSDSAHLVSLGSTVSLNSTGRPVSGSTLVTVYFGASSYKIVLKDSGGTTIRTADNITDIAFLAQLAVQPSQQTSTLTGTVNNFPLDGSPSGSGFTYSTLVLRMNNASATFITGFTAGVGGQRLIVVSVGAGDVFLYHQDAGSLASARMINLSTTAGTPLLHGQGIAEFVYDGVTFRWRMVRHEMGNYGTYTPTWGIICSVGPCTLPTVGNGTLTGRYLQVGRMVFLDIRFVIGSTSVMPTGTHTFTFTLPIAAVDTTSQVGGTASVLDNTTRYWHLIPTLTTTSTILLNMIDNSSGQASSTVPMTWTTNDAASISMWYFIP